MPTYEYECQDCGHTFDAFHGIKAEPISVCPKCKGKVKRIVGTSGGFLFKGTGFYCTDFKNSGGSAPAKSDK